MASEFGELLAELVGTVPGAIGAVFVDWDGEAVDQFGHIPELDIRIIGAHWGIVVNLTKRMLQNREYGKPEIIILSSEKRDVIIKTVTPEYFVVLTMKRGAHLGHALKEMSRVSDSIRHEMGW